MARPDGRHHRQIPGPQITPHNSRWPQPPPRGAPAPHTPPRRPASRPGAVFMSVGPPACMSLFVCPRFTLSLSGTHTLRSLLRSLRYVLPSEGVAVSVFLHFIARGKAHTGHGTSTPERAAPVILSLWSLFFNYSGSGLFSSWGGRVQLLILVFLTPYSSLRRSQNPASCSFGLFPKESFRVQKRYYSYRTLLFLKNESLFCSILEIDS